MIAIGQFETHADAPSPVSGCWISGLLPRSTSSSWGASANHFTDCWGAGMTDRFGWMGYYSFFCSAWKIIMMTTQCCLEVSSDTARRGGKNRIDNIWWASGSGIVVEEEALEAKNSNWSISIWPKCGFYMLIQFQVIYLLDPHFLGPGTVVARCDRLLLLCSLCRVLFIYLFPRIKRWTRKELFNPKAWLWYRRAVVAIVRISPSEDRFFVAVVSCVDVVIIKRKRGCFTYSENNLMTFSRFLFYSDCSSATARVDCNNASE